MNISIGTVRLMQALQILIMEHSDLGLNCLSFCIVVDSSTVICWTSPFANFRGGSGLFCRFYSILMENPDSK